MEENSPAHEIASNVSGRLDASWCVLLGDHGGPKDAHGIFKRQPTHEGSVPEDSSGAARQIEGGEVMFVWSLTDVVVGLAIIASILNSFIKAFNEDKGGKEKHD